MQISHISKDGEMLTILFDELPLKTFVFDIKNLTDKANLKLKLKEILIRIKQQTAIQNECDEKYNTWIKQIVGEEIGTN